VQVKNFDFLFFLTKIFQCKLFRQRDIRSLHGTFRWKEGEGGVATMKDKNAGDPEQMRNFPKNLYK